MSAHAAGDVVLVAANLRTLDPARPRASVLAVRGGLIAYVGGDAGAARGAVPPNTPVLDLAGRTVTPGLIDSHTHLAGWARARSRLSLKGVASMEQALALVQGAHAALAPGARLSGEDVPPFGTFGPMPARADLDRAAPGRVVILRGRDRHVAWVSGAALEQAGVTRATPDPAGGRIGRDARGEPDGLLYENAIRLLGSLDSPGDADEGALERALGELGALGLTGAHEFGDDGVYRAFAALRARGRLPLRIAFGFMRAETGGAPDALGPALREADDQLWPFALKGFVDGTLGSRTAWMLEPFDDGGGIGVATLDKGELDQFCKAAQGAGVTVCLHAIGDRAVRGALDAFERASAGFGALLRPRIEHAQLVHPDDLPRFAGLDVVASMQSMHAVSDRVLAARSWGPRDAQGGYAWRQLEAAGARLALGSDVPIESPDPRLGIWAAVTGAGEETAPLPERALTVERAFHGYTAGAAFAAGRADSLGRLRAGFHADFVVWGQDPWALPPAALSTVPIDQTWVSGTRVWPAV